MALHAPSRTAFVAPSFALGGSTTTDLALQTSSPEVLRPFDALNTRSPLPGRSVPHGSHHTFSARPRRGFPHPLRSALVVFHDLDGLLLLVPCGLFQPLTPLGLGFLRPTWCSLVRVLRPLRSNVGGGGFVREVSGRSGFAARFRAPWLRSTAPVACAPVPAPAPRVSMQDRHPSPTRRGVCSFGDRAALGLP